MNDKNSKEFTSIIKEMILELENNTEILDVEDEELNENNWENNCEILFESKSKAFTNSFIRRF